MGRCNELFGVILFCISVSPRFLSIGLVSDHTNTSKGAELAFITYNTNRILNSLKIITN